jgi:cytochrome c oxidase cbb3-type subunit 3
MYPNDPRPDAGQGDPLTGHEYDGIVEYDNPMPAWWRRTFWATVVFSLGYLVHYEMSGNGPSVEQSYELEMAEHRERVAAQALGEELTEEGLANLMHDPALMKDARRVYVARCVQCHADRGQGNIGPNLTDDHWLYGSARLMDLHEIVSNGRPQKGMPAWARQLRPVELAQVAAYVGTLRNTNVVGRPPQGSRIVAQSHDVAPGTSGG